MKKRNKVVSICLSVIMAGTLIQPIFIRASAETQKGNADISQYTGRYIVKYRGEEEEKLSQEKVETAFEQAKEEREIVVNAIGEQEEVQETNQILNAACGVTMSAETVSLESNHMDGQYQTIQLKEAVDPEVFIDALKKEAGKEIEYIQPDYIMELSAEGSSDHTVQVIVTDEGITAQTPEEMEPSEETVTAEPEPTAVPEEPAQGNEATAAPEEPPAATEGDEGESEEPPAESTEPEQTAEPEELQVHESVVALIDSGVDMSHSDLAGKLVNAYDFVKDTAEIEPLSGSMEYSHGTHLAGVIVSSAPQAKVMPLKVFENGRAYTSDIIEAIAYAQENGADLINCSWGSTEDNRALYEAMEESSLTFICAAGNYGVDIGELPYYPAGFDLDNIISVGSVNDDCALSYFSNYGTEEVDIAARGNQIQSTYPEGRYGIQSGTSVSAAFVSGAAACYLAENPRENLKTDLLDSADQVSCLDGWIQDGKLLNIDNLITHTPGQSLTVNAADSRRMAERTPEESWELFSLQNNVDVAVMGTQSFFLKGDGTVWMSGYNGPTQVSYFENIVDIEAYRDHIAAIDNQGRVYTWDGILYNDDDTYHIPEEYDFGNVKKVSCGDNYFLALTYDGNVWGWGENNYQGQAGGDQVNGYWDENGHYIAESYLPNGPTKIKYESGGSYLSNMKDIFAFYDVSYAIDSNNTLYHWGSINHTSLGTPYARYLDDHVKSLMEYQNGYTRELIVIDTDGSVTYKGITQEFTLSNAVSIENFTILNNDGTVDVLDYNWIYSDDWMDRWPADQLICTRQEGISGVQKIASSMGTNDTNSNKYYLAVTNDDKIYGWGDNSHHQINSSDETHYQNPVQITVGNDVVQEAVTLIDEQYNNPENAAYHLDQTGLERLGWSEYTNPSPSGSNWQSADLGEFSAQNGQLSIKKTGQTTQPSASTPASGLVYQVDKVFTYREDNWQGDNRVSMWTQNFKGKYQIDLKGSFNQQVSQLYYDILGFDNQGNEKIVGRYRIDPGTNGTFSVYNGGLNGGNVYKYPLWSNPTVNRQVTTELDSATSTFRTYKDGMSIPESTTVENASPQDTFNMTDWSQKAPGAYIKGIRFSVQKQETQNNTSVKLDSVKLIEVQPEQDCVYTAVRNLTMSALTDTPEAVTKDLNPLPASLDGAQITWTSSNPSVISNEGKMMQELSYDEDVTMTAKITNPQDGFTQYLDFHLTAVRPAGWGETFSGSFTGIAPDNEDDLPPTKTIEGLPMWYFEYPGVKTGTNGEIHNGQVLIKDNQLVFKKLSDRQTDNYKDCVVGWRWLDKQYTYQYYIGEAQIDIVASAKGTGTFRFAPTSFNEKLPFYIMLDASNKNIGIVYGEEDENGEIQQVTQRVDINPAIEHKYTLIIDTAGFWELKIDDEFVLKENGSAQRRFLKGIANMYSLSKLKVWITNVTMKDTEIGWLKSIEFTPIDECVDTEGFFDCISDIAMIYRSGIPFETTEDISGFLNNENIDSAVWSSDHPEVLSNTGVVTSPAGDTVKVRLRGDFTYLFYYTHTYFFDIKVPKFYKFTDSTPQGDTVQLNLEAANITDLKTKEFTIEYDTEDYEVTDLCMLTLGKETKRNQVMSPDIIITENLPGKISFRVNRDIPSGKRLSGILNSIQLKSKKNNSKNVKFYVTNLG